MIIGLMGKIGSGKDTVAEYLVKKYGFVMVGFGDVTREIAKEKGIEPTRENLLEIQKEMVSKYGIDYFPKRIARMIKEKKLDRVVVNGIRRPTDALTLKEEFGEDFKLVLVETDPKIRYERMLKRGRVGDPKQYLDFQKQEEAEIKSFGLDKTFKMAEKIITNNTSLEDLYKQVDELISSF